jgi:NAD(P)-dependent dehydrogenase (short-subunit alcohol dehydrogenase family)
MTTNVFPEKRFNGRTVLITGGGTGMGKAAALRFGREGANVVIAGRRPVELNQVVEEITAAGGIALAIPTDVSDALQVEALVKKTVATFGALHMAWNNAGVLGTFAPLQDMSLADFDTVMAINLRGVFACLKYEIVAMLEAGIEGAIVNTSSWTAHGAMPGLAAYAAGKAALDALTRTAALEVGAQQIRINSVSPGIIATPMASGVLATETAALPFRKHTPLQRIGQPEEVADAVVWLLSDEARFVTGQSLLVDGGFTLGGLRPWFNNFVAEHIG